MFSACFITFAAGTWDLVHVRDMHIQTDVEDALRLQALAAVQDEIPLSWVYWPYFDPAQGSRIASVLEEIADELKENLKLRRGARRGVAGTHLLHEKKAQAAILYIRG